MGDHRQTGKEVVDETVRQQLELMHEHGWEIATAPRSGRLYLRNRAQNRYMTFDDLYNAFGHSAEVSSFHELYDEMTFGDEGKSSEA